MTHVLFVDDEATLLHGIERGLRVRRVPWERGFADSGELALAYLEAHRVDIVVSDLAMPGMDGVALLREVATRYPQVTRAVLSGNFGVGDATSPIAHRWIAKPVTIAELIAHLEPLAWARPLLQHATWIPPIPGVVTREASLDDAVVAAALAKVAAELAPQLTDDPERFAQVGAGLLATWGLPVHVTKIAQSR